MMKFGIAYYWRDPVEIFNMAEDFLELRVFEEDIKDNYKSWKKKLAEFRSDWEDDITIHMPEYFPHPKTDKPTLIDPASLDQKLLGKSLEIISNLIKFANEIEASKIILHPGGISEKPVPEEHSLRIERLKKSLGEISSMDFKGELLLENMPWFYWKRDGTRWYSTICYFPQDFKYLLLDCDGIVLDLSHGFLCDSTGSNRYLEEYANLYKDKIHYLHVSDSLPPDKEGLQIGEGNINFSGLFDMLEKDKLWLIPEIWKGHENFGEDFQIALDKINHLI